MRSPIWTTISNLVMKHMENKIVNKLDMFHMFTSDTEMFAFYVYQNTNCIINICFYVISPPHSIHGWNKKENSLSFVHINIEYCEIGECTATKISQILNFPHKLRKQNRQKSHWSCYRTSAIKPAHPVNQQKIYKGH